MTDRIKKIAAIGALVVGLGAALMPQIVVAGEQDVSGMVKGESWDSDSRGLAYFGAHGQEATCNVGTSPEWISYIALFKLWSSENTNW